MRVHSRFVLGLVACLFGLALSGCSENRGERALTNYQERLLTVLERLEGVDGFGMHVADQVAEAAEASSDSAPLSGSNALVPPFPKKSVVSAADRESSSSIDLLDFLGLYGCRLQEVVAQANSSLGKFAPNSQRLLSALKFIELGPECVESLIENDKASLASAVSAEVNYKQSQVHWFVAKALFEGEEYRSFWDKPIKLGGYPKQLSSEPMMALSKVGQLLKAWSAGEVSHGVSELESQLFLIAQGDGGALVKAYELLNRELQTSNQTLERAIRSRTLCKQPNAYSRDILSNVVEKFFVGEVQVWASDLNRRQYEVMAAILPLEHAMSQDLSKDYLRWKERRDALFINATEQIKDHVQRLKILLEPDLLEKSLTENCQ